MKLTLIYDKLPFFLQNIAVSAYGLVREHRRFGGDYMQQLKQVQKTEFCTREEVHIYQTIKLNELFDAAETSRYYGSLLKSIRLQTSDPFEVLAKLPVLEKDMLRGHEDDFHTRESRKSLILHTSGSTGTPLNIKMSKSDFRLRMALLERQKLRYGVGRRSRHLTFVGKKITSIYGKSFWRYNIFGNQLVMSVYDLSEANKEKYLSKIRKYNPEVVEGYPSALTLIATWLKGKNQYLGVKCVFATAETLSAEQKSVIEDGFGCPVVNYYGSTEGATMITQCEQGNLHVDDESGIIEFVNKDGKPAKAGEVSTMLITSFTTKATPLIRYNIGDLAVISPEQCSCGRCGTVVSEIIGRIDDVFITPEKGYVGRMSTALKLLPSTVRGAQIHQYAPTRFVLLLETQVMLSDAQKALVLADMHDKLGNVDIDIQYTQQIPSGKNGKFRSQINHCRQKYEEI